MIYIDDSEPEGVLEPSFPYRDVTIHRGVDAKQEYDILSEVGRGKFGTVYKCQEKSTGLKLAAKFVPIPKREDKRNVEREVEIMNSLQHHLIIQLYAAYEHQKMMCVVLELVEGGELFDRVVEDEFVLTERVCVVIIRQVCEAMEFIHRNNILHLDLKPENILCLTQDGNRIKIIDFGLARKFDPDKRLQILFGTPEFVAPEVVNFDCISYATDMWSVGVICYVLISGLSPFMGETDIETMANVTIAKYDFEDESFSNISTECIDFISKLLVKDLCTRMTAEQCLQHKWLQRSAKKAPAIAPKPLNIPAAKIKAPTPSPVPVNEDDDNGNGNDNGNDNSLTHDSIEPTTTPAATTVSANNDIELNEKTKELDTTKDNLKNFIERWEEHPNSPYVFDVEGNVIAPLNDTTTAKDYKKLHGVDSLSSSRVCSPSPCESIGTITDEDIYAFGEEQDQSPSALATPMNESREKLFPSGSAAGSGTTTPISSVQFPANDVFASKLEELSGSTANMNSLQQRSMKSYLHTFDRRNSDTNYLLGRRTSGERVNLADEIRKLSDHLLMLADINTKLDKDMKKDSKVSDSNNNKSKKTKTTASSALSKTKQDKLNKPIGKLKTVTESHSSSCATTEGGKTKFSSMSLRLQQSIEETPKLINGSDSWKTQSSFKKSTIRTINTANAKSQGIGNAETASTRRAKFRISQMSRDVPMGLPNVHQPVNLEEAANTTKDCLLHLLEKYNETKLRNPLGRHQSISVDWNVRDNLEYRSMSSINAFFQRHNNTRENVRQLQAQLENKAASTGTGKES